ncbi:MAG: DUF3883 domain-containing protein [Herbaspirillum sp.]|uniref:DUF3883 domain-containing protein n=1 Tax=Herbaspirillum sp. TaxID=1890675 RepID=UPI002582E7AF|nr:DUF3883 domain-containing protein [Herbaspirillum sp.]MCP3657592.1 DUF3883 domain-containing protein [Herbaspirillum sp.]MCP3949764.1 DUF3883 domain-containing protein [Herbaspirillum sp.]MCP4035015.1 DUF3883 domain-containing protein [Herbaspirillum sp.]MCP4556494.1 DUF3883 domain-containing protein [Herbaspirillum sp.]
MKKILWVKFGWSEYYRGGPVDGNFGWINKNRGKKEVRAHEAFNFYPDSNGTYYCYVPPQGEKYAPANSDPYGWTVICLARKPGHTGIHVVGWYEDATLHGEWLEPAADIVKKRGDTINPAYDWSYCITSRAAYFILPEHRTVPFSDSSVRQGKYSFLEGPNVTENDNKRRVLSILEDKLRKLKGLAILNPTAANAPDPELDAADPLIVFGDADHRKRVEKASESLVIDYYESQGFGSLRVTHLPCGYDFAFSKDDEVLHVEVKGTAGATPRFFLTRNEYLKGKEGNPNWRLAMVTSALSDNPRLKIYSAKELDRFFDMETYVYIANFIPEVKRD